MNNIEILKQLLNGNHLEKKELEKAKNIIHGLKMNLKSRLEKE